MKRFTIEVQPTTKDRWVARVTRTRGGDLISYATAPQMRQAIAHAIMGARIALAYRRHSKRSA